MTSSRSLKTLFNYRHFNREIIILCVRWYVSYKLSFRDRVKMMAERGQGRALAAENLLGRLPRYHDLDWHGLEEMSAVR